MQEEAQQTIEPNTLTLLNDFGKLQCKFCDRLDIYYFQICFVHIGRLGFSSPNVNKKMEGVDGTALVCCHGTLTIYFGS
jgi:hypothetical protein